MKPGIFSQYFPLKWAFDSHMVVFQWAPFLLLTKQCTVERITSRQCGIFRFSYGVFVITINPPIRLFNTFSAWTDWNEFLVVIRIPSSFRLRLMVLSKVKSTIIWHNCSFKSVVLALSLQFSCGRFFRSIRLAKFPPRCLNKVLRHWPTRKTQIQL